MLPILFYENMKVWSTRSMPLKSKVLSVFEIHQQQSECIENTSNNNNKNENENTKNIQFNIFSCSSEFIL